MGHETAGAKEKSAGYTFISQQPYEQFQVIAVCTGRLLLRHGDREEALLPGQTAVLGRGSRFALRCQGGGYRGVFYISVTPFPGDPGRALAVPAAPGLRSLAALLASLAEAPGPDDDELLLDLGRAMARFALRQAAPAERADAADAWWWAERARLALAANLRTGAHPRSVLAPLGLSYRQLARHLRAVDGLPPKRLQLRLRLEAAADLLRCSRQQITAIAMELGFPSSQHFATCFRAAYGRSPTQWRREA